MDPRFAISTLLSTAIGLIAHFSYDRVFQTPSFENILLSSSFEVASINPDFLRLPVLPSQGNYYEAGISKAFGNNLRADVNYYLRNVNNYADDDQIENTTIKSFPIAFQKSKIYGAEAKLTSAWLAWAIGIRQLFLHGGQRMAAGYRRTLSGRRCASSGNATNRTFSGFTGPAQHVVYAMGLSGKTTLLDCRRPAIWQRFALRI